MPITLNCTGYRRRINGDVTAVVSITADDGPILFSDRVVLTSAKSRAQFARAVLTRLGESPGIDADRIETQLLEILQEAEAALSSDPNPYAPAEEPGTERVEDYLLTPHGFFRIYTCETSDGIREREVRLSNFVARIRREVIVDDGITQSRFFEIAGEYAGTRLPVIRVAAAEFERMSWIAENWGARPRLMPVARVRDLVRDAIQALSSSAEFAHVFAHTGWRKLGKRWVFLHGGGGITGDGVRDNVYVELPEALGGYQLPEPPTGERLKEAVRLAWGFYDAAEPSVSAAFLGAAYAAVLAEWLRPDFSLWGVGPSGRLKTSYAACVTAHFGEFDTQTVPGNWESTTNALEVQSSAAKDVVFLIDDFRPAVDRHEAVELRRKVARLIRAAGNRTGRARLSSTLNLRPVYAPRGVIVSTAEDWPIGESAAARCWVVAFGADSVDTGRLAFFQERTEALRLAASSYINWLAARLDRQGPEWIPATLAKVRAALRGFGVHLRQARIAACLTVGWAVFSEFAVSVGAITEEEALTRGEHVRQALRDAILEQSRNLVEDRPETVFVGTLLELIATGDAYLEDPDGGPPPDAHLWGWEDPESGRPRPGAVRIGWLREDAIDLNPSTALGLIQRRCRDAGIPWVWSRRALYANLARGGFVAGGTSKTTVCARTATGIQRVLRLRREAVEAFRTGCNTVSNTSDAVNSRGCYTQVLAP